MKRKVPFIVLSNLLVFVFLLFSAQPGLGEEESPMVITAESLEIELDKNRATFLGGVKAVHAQGVLEAQELRVVFNKETGDINKLIAEGGVKISQGDNVGLCEEAVYEFTPKRKVTLKVNPQLRRGKQKLNGEIIVFLIDEQRVIIKNKVRGVIFPQKGEKNRVPVF